MKPVTKPLLIFDGDCGFCRVWIERWKKVTGDRVDYAASQDVGPNFPEIPPESYEKAVQLIEPDGRISSGAQAVFRTLRYAGSSGGLWAYEKIPGFAAFSEYCYGIVSGHRPTFSMVTRWLWGGVIEGACGVGEPSSYRQVRWLFLRAMAIIYAIAFWSFGRQVKALVGSQGILPAHDFLGQLTRYGAARFWYVPSLAWLNSSDAFFIGMCVAGVIFSLLLLINVAPRYSLIALWILYLSLASIGGDFMNFQWDALLLETGFLAIWFAPTGLLPQRRGSSSPSGVLVFLLRWLLFRLMIQSALVKWLSGDPLWHHLTALTVHYQTQPLPNPISWYVHHFPLSIHKFSCAAMFVIEGVLPILIFMPRRPRFVAFWGLCGLQSLIFLTGNYTYFNLLALTLCLLLLDDAALRSWVPAWWDEPLTPTPIPSGRGQSRNWVRVAALSSALYLTSVPFARVFGIGLPQWVVSPVIWASSLRSFNSYGLFAVMTPKRPEIIIEGSIDGQNWLPYEFKYKPGDLSRRPRQVAPDQPRLDWQMWFAALGDYRQNTWFMNLCVRLLQGSKLVTGLLAYNPFPESPPVYLRATLYEYRFTTPAERRQTGKWWARDNKGLYCPILSFRNITPAKPV